LCCLLFMGFFTFAAFFPSVLWYCWLSLLTCKTVSQITYTVLVETLNPARSINQLSLWCLLAVMKHIKSSSSTNSRTWWRHPRCKRGLPSSCSSMTQAPDSWPVFELLVSKHMAQTKFSSPHSWMSLVASSGSYLWNVQQLLLSHSWDQNWHESIHLFFTRQVVSSICHPSVQPMWWLAWTIQEPYTT